ncbi:MAG: hypothetical protein PWP31_1617 [Clostridia bacterium]|nr:hypothetical protein [Clostridia bacterium]
MANSYVFTGFDNICIINMLLYTTTIFLTFSPQRKGKTVERQ